MSIINKMLQDLDRRQGMPEPGAATIAPQVRSVPAARGDREWFWRIIAVLMIAAVGWVGWIAWQLQPREPVVTEQAFKAAQNAKRTPSTTAQAPSTTAQAPSTTAQAPGPVAPVPVAPVPVDEKPAPAAVAEAAKPAAPVVDVLKLSKGIEAPIPAQPAKHAAKAQPKPGAVPTPAAPVVAATAAAPVKSPARLSLDVPPARILEGPAPTPAKVEKRDRTRSPEERAEQEFRRGVGLLNQGRTSEAEEVFAATLAAQPTHEAARQALVAMNLEQQHFDIARRLLQEGVAIHPGNARFASVLARILIERKDYAGALEVVIAAKAPAQNDAELQSMRGTALQRLGRHAEAAEAFQVSLRSEPQNGSVWMGLGVSLEAQAKRPEAAEAFRRAAGSGTLGAEARSYAEQRARQLR